MSEMPNFAIELNCTLVEIYLNELRDLLLKAGEKNNGELDVKEDRTGRVVISNVTTRRIESVERMEEVFEEGLKHRKTRKTSMNNASSRSHLIFTIEIKCTCTNLVDAPTTIGKLSFIDLAGSEKSSKTEITDEVGKKEAISINQSLSSLGNVIHALSIGSKHIPYKDSILTRVMKDSLGGTAKTLMFVNCSPSVYNTAETKNSLRYAESAKKVTNKVSKGVETKEI